MKQKRNVQCRLAPALCYAIGLDDGFIIGFGASVVAAWNAAEDCTGDKCKTLKKQGYKLLEGKWQNGKLTPPPPEKD